MMRLFKYLAVFIFLVAISATIAGVLFAVSPLELKSSPLDFEIPSGVGLKGAAKVMADSGISFTPWQFSLLGRLLGKDTGIKAGSYEIETGVTPMQLLAKLTLGDFNQGELALVEGKTFRQFRALLDAHPFLKHDTTALTDQQIMVRLGASETYPEGLFAPDTYLFMKNSSDLDLLRRAYRAMQARIGPAWDKRAPNLPYQSPYEALIMASVIEKETGVESDRPQIAAVFLNRLRIGMPLQTDPSVIYGLGEHYDGRLHKVDLLTDTPYNTYTRPGLPPSPISMPGVASLQAALHPPASDKLYFVSRGDGTSVFSSTLEEHNQAVARYQKGKEPVQ